MYVFLVEENCGDGTSYIPCAYRSYLQANCYVAERKKDDCSFGGTWYRVIPMKVELPILPMRWRYKNIWRHI